MNCRRVEQLLPLYVGGDVSERRARGVDAHLRACDACRRLADEHRRTRELLQAYDAPEFGGEFFASVRGAVLEELAQGAARPSSLQRLYALVGREPHGRPPISPRAFTFAALLLAVACGLILLTARRERPAAESAQSVGAPPARLTRPEPDPKPPADGPEAGRAFKPSADEHPAGKGGGVLAAFAGREPARRMTPTRARREARLRRPAKSSANELLPGEESYLKAISALDAVISRNRSGMSLTLRAEYERHLSDVDRAIAGTRVAALRHRDNPDMQEFVFTAYRGKVALLSEIAKKTQGDSEKF